MSAAPAPAIMRNETGAVYVQCSGYCGARIYQPGREDHDEECGADDDEIKFLDDSLAAAKIQAAAAAEPDAPLEAEVEVSIECPDCKQPIKQPGSADHLFDCAGTGEEHAALSDRLATLHTAAARASTDPHVVRTEVDGGRPAELHATPAPAEYSAMWRDPDISLAWVHELQHKIDMGDLAIGGIAAGKACLGKMTVQPEGEVATEIGCPHRCAVRTVRKNECDLEHTHTETIAQVCLLHAITALGGEVAVQGFGPLFGEQ